MARWMQTETARASGAFSVALGAGLVANGPLASAVGVSNSADGTEGWPSAGGDRLRQLQRCTVGRDKPRLRRLQQRPLAREYSPPPTIPARSATSRRRWLCAARRWDYQTVAGVSGTVSFGHSATDLTCSAMRSAAQAQCPLDACRGPAPTRTDAVNPGQLDTAIPPASAAANSVALLQRQLHRQYRRQLRQRDGATADAPKRGGDWQRRKRQ